MPKFECSSHASRRRPGLAANVIDNNNRKEKHQIEQQSTISSDTANRKAVAKEIKALIEDGKAIEEATKIAVNNPKNRENFKYLIDAGINIEQTFKNIYLGSLKSKGFER